MGHGIVSFFILLNFNWGVNILSTSNKKNVLKEIWEWVYTIVIAFLIAILIKGFLFDIVKVDGSSMYPTLKDKDRLIVTKLGYEPEAGDIIILDSTYKNREEYFDNQAEAEGKEEFGALSKAIKYFTLPKDLKHRYYVKRIIALPGQTVELKDGRVYVDGSVLEELYYDGETYPTDTDISYPITVEEDMLFVMGDNRGHSLDSRSSRLGQVPYDAVLGKAQFRIFPFNKMGMTR